MGPIFLLRTLMRAYISLFNFVSRRDLRERLLQPIAQEINEAKRTVTHKIEGGASTSLTFYSPNEICAMRARTFSTKEPEVLRWIDEYGDGVLWDIGANIGLYSIYYALSRRLRVVAFEPSFFNLKQLAKNVDANGVNELVDIVPLALCDLQGMSSLKLSTTDEGGALSAFGVNYGHDGQPIQAKTAFRTLGSTGDEVSMAIGSQSLPRLLKIDVDGIEPLILKGMRKILSRKECRSVFIEVNDSFESQASQVAQLLSECGFVFKEKARSAMFDQSKKHSHSFNQVWVKK